MSCASKSLLNALSRNILYVPFRNGHHLRGKPPGIAKSLKEKLAEREYKDESIHFRVDIGLPPPRIQRSKVLKERLKILKNQKSNAELEALARSHQLTIDLNETHKEWLKTKFPYDIKGIADHYGVFKDLFGDAYFYPQVALQIVYNTDNVSNTVYYGNCLKPSDATSKPEVNFEADGDSLWTLIMTNPDGHFEDNDKEYIHWFVGNIPGNQVEKGETLVEYLQPFPPKGTGYHRYIFVLYKQNKMLDFSQYKQEGKCLNLPARTFSTYYFYRDLQDVITPAGLSFFQADWCPSLKDFFHKVLKMKEPVYEYDFPPPYIKKQEWFPLRKPFNLYMDKYRDPKQINKEFLLRKLKNVHPFRPPSEPLPYPNARYFKGYVPSWLKLEIQKSRLRWGRINDIE